jgi:hypothetical protein
MTNLLLVRSVRNGEIMEKSTEKYHGTLMNTYTDTKLFFISISKH